MEASSKDMNQLNCATNNDICKSVNDQRAVEDFGFQHQLFQACVDIDKSGTSESSSVSKEIQETHAGASDSDVTHQKHKLKSQIISLMRNQKKNSRMMRNQLKSIIQEKTL
jgi:hypothetical protein